LCSYLKDILRRWNSSLAFVIDSIAFFASIHKYLLKAHLPSRQQKSMGIANKNKQTNKKPHYPYSQEAHILVK
jgi:hypothetical protein